MNIEFKFDGGYAFKDLVLLNRVAIKRHKFLRFFVPVLRILTVLLSAVLIFLGATMMFSTEPSYVMGPLYLLLGVLWLLFGLFFFQYNAWRSRRLTAKSKADRTITFREDSFTETFRDANSTYRYEAVHEALFYKDAYLVFIDKNHAFPLPVRCLTSGTPGEFERLFNEKCEKKIKKLEKSK